MAVKNKKLIVVLGMHRSGTSAITRGLKVLGADFGKNLQAPMSGVNDKGFFEDNDIVTINVEALLILSHDWHTLSPITRAQLKNDSLAELRLRAIELLREKMQSVNVFAIKDPRLARLLPFWQDIFDALNIDVSYVIAVRNPLSVAKSLVKRDNIEKEKSCYLWLEHVLPSILETSGKRRVVVDYDNMLDQPRIELARIAKALGLKADLHPDELITYVKKFLDIGLRHAEFDINELTSDPSIPKSVVSVYLALVKVGAGKWSLEKTEVQDCVQQAAMHLNELAPALSYMTRQDVKITEFSKAMTERDAHITELRQDVTERDAQITGLRQDVTERDAQITGLRQDVAKYNEQVANLQRREKQLQILSDELRNEIKALLLSNSWRITKPFREISNYGQKFMQFVRVYRNYRKRHPGFNGITRLSSLCVNVIRKENIGGVRNQVALSSRIMGEVSVLAKSVEQQCSANKIDLLHTYLEKGLILSPTIIFDHNGGGGSNIYTNELVGSIHANGGSALRVYCFEAIWFIQWIGNGNDNRELFYTSSMEQLFESLSLSRSTSIVLNSMYGYPDIKEAVRRIIGFAQSLSATLDVKMHDFFPLCPSPHLSDFEGKYCGVPQEFGVCAPCLKQNLGWYHAWYPKENLPVDIIEWRRPFIDIFEAANTVTFFDRSSVDIVRSAFSLQDNKIRVIPHSINYFECDNPIDVTGQLHVGIIGTLSIPKGGHVVNNLACYIQEQGFDVKVYVIGSSYVETTLNVNVLGKYTPNDLPKILTRHGVNVILMPSIIPETFSYTISEAMKMGLPIVAFDIGAQGNRVKQYEFGKVVPLGSSSEVVLSAIQSVQKKAEEFRK